MVLLQWQQLQGKIPTLFYLMGFYYLTFLLHRLIYFCKDEKFLDNE